MTEFLRWFLTGVACAVTALYGAAHAQEPGNNLGASLIGLCHRLWPCDESLKVFNGVPVKRLGFLAPPTFGKTCPCYKKFLNLPGPKFVRVHLANGTCFSERGRACGKGEVFEGETVASADRKLRRRRPDLLRRYRHNALRTKRILSAGPDPIVRPALCLECPVSRPARRALLAVAREVFPGGVFVDSVLTQSCLKAPDIVCEKHGEAPRLSAPCLADTDGVSHTDIDVGNYREATAACETTFLWTKRFNLLDNSGRFVPPPLRTTRPTRADFAALRYWLLD